MWENPNKFVFLRSFLARGPDRTKDAFYGSETWKNELEAIAMPLLDSYDVSTLRDVTRLRFRLGRQVMGRSF